MYRLLTAGIAVTFIALYTLLAMDSTNAIFELVSINSLATLLHIVALAIVIMLGVQEYFEHIYIRLLFAALGITLLGVGIIGLLSPALDAVFKIFDFILMLELGLAMTIASLNNEPPEPTYDEEPHSPAEAYAAKATKNTKQKKVSGKVAYS